MFQGSPEMSWAPKETRCPHSQITQEALLAVEWHHNYSRLRVLPFGGTDLMKQPAYVFEAINAVDHAVLGVEAEQREKQREEDERAKAEAESKQRQAEALERRRGRR